MTKQLALLLLLLTLVVRDLPGNEGGQCERTNFMSDATLASDNDTHITFFAKFLPLTSHGNTLEYSSNIVYVGVAAQRKAELQVFMLQRHFVE